MSREFISPMFSKILEVGESSIPRAGLGGGTALITGVTYLSYFKAEKSENINNLIVRTAATGATGTTSLRLGIYTLDWSRVPTGDFIFFFGLEPGDLHQIAATANTTAVTAASTKYTVPLTSTWYKERGVDYALAVLFIGTTGPTLMGQGTLNSAMAGDILGTYPMIAESLTPQADLYSKYSRAARNPSQVISGGVNTIGNTTSGSAVVTITAAAGDGNTQTFFRADDAGQPISGTGIPGGAYITTWNSFTSVNISANATSTNTNITLTIGPSPFSPTTQPRVPYVEFAP